MLITKKEICRIADAWSESMLKNRDELIRLDAIAGDGDLGLSMNDGFSAICRMLSDYGSDDIGIVFYSMGKTMNISASSSLGTLISAGFMAVGKVYHGKSEINGCDLGRLLDVFMSGVITLGKAKLGEKTFLDAFYPAVEVMKKCPVEDDVPEYLKKMAYAARDGANNTVGMLAHWGRAARRGEESRALLDPGAEVAALMMQALSDALTS